MGEYDDWNAKIIEEFRANDGKAAAVEAGTETYDVKASEVTGAERDALYAEQAQRYPGFAEYEEKTKGIRTIPVLALART